MPHKPFLKVKIALHLLALLIFLTAVVIVRFPGAFRGAFYALYREAARAKVVLNTRTWCSLESAHFLVRYRPGEVDNAQLLLQTAEHFYAPVAGKYNFRPRDKIVLVLHSSRKDLNACFGWPASERATGVYWGGVIRVLSPGAWINAPRGEREALFVYTGPVAHELVHLVVDYQTRGNCPRWFTEGLAQYEDLLLTGFRFAGGEDLPERAYPFHALDRDFDSLPDQALAYRQSLSAVEYIVDVYGEGALHSIISNLAQGHSMPAALAASLQLDRKAFEQGWRRWAGKNKGGAAGRNCQGRVELNKVFKSAEKCREE